MNLFVGNTTRNKNANYGKCETKTQDFGVINFNRVTTRRTAAAKAAAVKKTAFQQRLRDNANVERIRCCCYYY